MQSAPELSILIVNFNSGRLTLDCLASISRHAARLSHEVIVADNGSQDGSAELIERHDPGVKLLRLQENLGFGAASNRAAAMATGRYLLLLNNDALLLENSLDPLLDDLRQDPAIGIVGPEIRFPDGRFQLSCGPDHGIVSEFFMKHFAARYSRRIQRGPQRQIVDWVSGAAMLLSAELYRRVGGFDEAFFLYMEDADLCRRVRKLGLRVLLDRRGTVIHLLGETTGRDKGKLLPAIKRGQLHYYARHNGRLSCLLLKSYLFLRYRWDGSLPPPLRQSLLDTIRAGEKCRN